MAEMRRGGLRGKALIHPGMKGLEGFELKSGKGSKGLGGRGRKRLEAIPECKESDGGLEEGMAGEGSGGVVGKGSSSRRPGQGESASLEWKPTGDCSEGDPALDLIASQPLQEMEFVWEQVIQLAEMGGYEKDCDMVETRQQAESEGNSLLKDSLLGTNDDFPPLSKEGLRVAKEKERDKGVGGKEDPRNVEQPGKGKMDRNKEGLPRGQNIKGDGNKWMGGKNYKASLADGMNLKGNSPVSFEPGKIKKMGVLGESSRLPSIHFSGDETSFLAEKLGFAVVGKFSHSIPSSLHLQRAFQGMKFVGEYTWKYINAKHVLVQFLLIEDYAKLLSGPNGLPVWFVDRHPMRVFKWTQDFDPFFESPIAAVWCNLIGLPIHLFEKSALFSIGSLLGEPLQVDHATITRSRLSFARLCTEIDISQTPVQEIILNLQGREIRQVVKWDRIPLYCPECKHVGHSRDVCYANGQRVRPAKRDYKAVVRFWVVWVLGRGLWGVSRSRGLRRGRWFWGVWVPRELEGVCIEQGSDAVQVGVEGLVDSFGSRAGESLGLLAGAVLDQGGEGFQVQGKKKGKQGKGAWDAAGLRGGSLGGLGMAGVSGGAVAGSFSENSSANRFSLLSVLPMELEGGSLADSARDLMPNIRYMKALPNGDFDPEEYEDEKDRVCEEDLEDEAMMQQERGTDKRGAALVVSTAVGENSKQKKGRVSSSGAVSSV